MATATDQISLEARQYMNGEVTRVLHALQQQHIRYSIWGAAATEYHGGEWLWKCQDYEILINDWFDGPVLRKAVDAITARCHPSWLHDHRFDETAWATAKGDRPPQRPIRRFKHVTLPSSPTITESPYQQLDFGVLLIPADSTHVVSTWPRDLVDATTPADPAWVYPALTHIPTDPAWIYPSLKNYVESQLTLWYYEGRNSALLDLQDVITARKLRYKWAHDVGLDVARERSQTRPEVPSQWEVWEELVENQHRGSNHRRATARFRARRAESERLAGQQTDQNGESEDVNTTGAVQVLNQTNMMITG